MSETVRPGAPRSDATGGEKSDAEEIKVTDRRRFDSSGRLRPGVQEQEDDEADAPARPVERTVDRKVSRDERPSQAKSGSPRPGPEAGRAGGPRAGVDFQAFVYFLYMSALHELGVPTEPGAPAGRTDLERAQFFIEVLQVLEEKTKGNLAPGESKLLEEVLYNLRMQYVAASKQPRS